MPMIPKNARELSAAVNSYLKKFPGDTVCALQIWYEGLGGQGVPNPAEMEEMHAVLNGITGWKPAGKIRYEKFGQQQSFRRVI